MFLGPHLPSVDLNDYYDPESQIINPKSIFFPKNHSVPIDCPEKLTSSDHPNFFTLKPFYPRDLLTKLIIMLQQIG